MNYLDSVSILVNKDFQEVAKSPELLLSLLRTYSDLYLSGGQPSTCEKCHYKYHNQLKSDGMKKAELMEEVKARTLVPKFSGRRYVHAINSHIDSAMLTDKQAIDLLKKKVLRESDFETLPKGFKKAAPRKSRAKKTIK